MDSEQKNIGKQLKSVVMLVGPGSSTNIVYHYLSQKYPIKHVVMEQKISARAFFSQRLKKLSWKKVMGQLLFIVIIVKWLNFSYRTRKTQILHMNSLDDSYIDSDKIIHVNSVNSAETISILQQLQPDVIVVNGTRIISESVLNSVNARFINMHMGITPLYRGVHGGYWALVDKRYDTCGVSIHLVDKGIDTGGILYQGNIQPSLIDSFVTYPLLQLAAGLPLLNQAVTDCMYECVQIQNPPPGTSKLWTHPTFWEYLRYRITHGIK